MLLLVNECAHWALENQLLSVSLLTHLGKRECIKRIPYGNSLHTTLPLIWLIPPKVLLSAFCAALCSLPLLRLFDVDLCARFCCSFLWYVVMLCRLPEVFLEAVPLSTSRGVTVYILPPLYLASARLGNVVVVFSHFIINHPTTDLRGDQDLHNSKNSTRRTMAPGVVKPKIRGNVNFEIKSQFIRELREDTFSGNKNEDAHDHVDRLLNIWHDGTSSRNVSYNSNTDGVAAIVRPYLDKECTLNEEVKQVEEVKYGEFRRPTPFNGSNRAMFREESARRSAQMDEWIKKLQENAEINTRNQSASLKNLETQIKQLTKELKSRTTNRAPSSSTGQCKVINADHETPNIPISLSKLNILHGVSFLSDSDSQ
ncbi:hypothetical protein Tco_1267017, partial [Tanacetum coccineum]